MRLIYKAVPDILGVEQATLALDCMRNLCVIDGFVSLLLLQV